MNMLHPLEVGALIALALSDGPATYEEVINTSTTISRVPSMTGAVDRLVKMGLAAPTGDRFTLTGQAFRECQQLKLICSQFYRDGLG